MITLITLSLLLFEFQYSYGHTLPRKEMLKNVDFYSIQDNNNESITLISSKSKNPTVKEIIYYHVIERPYEKSQVMVTHTEETDEGPDFDDTKRPFTNGHGLQFSDLDSDDDHDNDNDTSDENDSTEEENSQSSEDTSADDKNSDDDEDGTESQNVTESDNYTESDDSNRKSDGDEDSKTDEEDSNDNDDVSGESSSDSEDDDDVTGEGGNGEYNENDRIDRDPVEIRPVTEQTFDSKVSSGTTKSIERTTTKMTETSEDLNTIKTGAVLVTTEPVSTTAVDDVTNEKRAARNMLFNQLRDRYQKSLKPSKAPTRKKREVKYDEDQDNDDKKELPEMPEAPTLPELNYDQLPTYVREMISTEKPVIREQDKEDDEADKEIEHRIEEMINEVMRPYEEELEEEREETPIKPRTYGMKLNAGKGYVWNDLWSNPGMSFDVGDSPTHSNEEDSKENLYENPDYEIEPFEKDTSEETQKADDSKPNLEDIFINKNKDKNKNKETEETEENLVKEEDKSKGTTESDLNDNNPVHTDNEAHKSEETETEKEDVLYHNDTTERSVDESTKANHKEMDLGAEKEDSLTPEGNTEKDMKKQKPRRIKNIKELLKDQDEDFWTWLQDWTSTYMDLLMKHIKKIIQQEVKKQIKFNMDHLNQDKSDTESEPSIESQKDEKEMENPQDLTKDGSIIVDGVQIPLTHSTNFDSSLGDNEFNENYKSDLLKGRRHKEKVKDKNIVSEVSNIQSESDIKKPHDHNVTNIKSKKGEKLDAKNIFGNSYNNDKVTNIYIFYPNADSKKIFEDLTSNEDNKNNTLIFGKPEYTNVKEREDISIEANKEELKPIKVESADITDKISTTTVPITLTEDKETSTATESSNKNGDSDNEANKSEKHNQGETHKESISEKEYSITDEKDKSDKDHNVSTETSNKDEKTENKEDESENYKELEEKQIESNVDKEHSTTDKKDITEEDLNLVDSIDNAKKENETPDLSEKELDKNKQNSDNPSKDTIGL